MGHPHQDSVAPDAELTTALVNCPRGWGQVAFVANGIRIGFLEHPRWKCPIGGVSHCVECRHRVNPQEIERLREQLDQLRLMRKQGLLDDAEFNLRRQAIIDVTGGRQGKVLFAFRIVAWLLGPPGCVLCIAGACLAAFVHPGFLGMLGGGAILVALSISFGALSLPFGLFRIRRGARMADPRGEYDGCFPFSPLTTTTTEKHLP